MSDWAFIGPRSPAQLRSAVSFTYGKAISCVCPWSDCGHKSAYTAAKRELFDYLKQSGERRAFDDNHIPPIPKGAENT